ncbi:MAG: TetM/TetW/TetO/TetS family tetracycline resistance ribosomal protection protein [Oscillospiraceae bacterium]|nr:TetM/TetW/TetO/TetS family tetracycline resistance ribosomal protection protein [Oscillospiraceae bacterium]
MLAHVDSGKTTLTEALLFTAGEIRKLGRVDHADAFLDTDEIERSRGITVFAKQAVLRLAEAELTLLDTPGHADLASETERALDALDYAVLVISAADGVRGHTETLWRLLKKHRTPTFIFINKMDRPDADAAKLLALVREKLSDCCVDFGSASLADDLAMCDETLMEDLLSLGSVPDADVVTAIARRRVFPCFFGSALKLEGIDALLAALEKYTREPPRMESFGARVFKIGEDAQGTRLTYLALTGGSLKVKTALSGVGQDGERWTEKADQLRIYSGTKYALEEEVFPGQIAAITGLTKTRPGEGLGVQPPSDAPTLEPVMSCAVLLPEGDDPHAALAKLRRLEEEEPMLRLTWDGADIRVSLMGQVQLEVIKAIVKRRFGMDVDFGPARVVYKETIARAVEGVGHYEPLRHYAEVHLRMEPGERGSGLVFASDCRTDDLDLNWQRLILTHLAEKTHVGVLTGAPITDMKITLVSGRAHLKHTEGGDFRQATYRAVRQGLRLAGTVLLEPWYDFTLEVPQGSVGRAMSDIQRMCGRFGAPETEGETAVLRGSVPAATSGDYRRDVLAYTAGRGSFTCVFRGYEPCHNADEVVAASGYDPDSDVENTADSVFCAHGAGFVVRWDAVYSHMHIPAEKDRKALEPAAADLLRDRAAAYCDSLARDKELLAIFERTYGPVKYDLRRALAPGGEAAMRRAKAAPDLREYLLVDGYNIIFAWDDLRALAADSMEAARSSLINLMCNYQGVRRCELILVFDAYRVHGGRGSVERVHNINVVYTREAETADMYIEKVAHGLGERRRVRVATSDGLEQLIVLGQGARRISAEAFRAEVDETMRAIRDYLAKMQ